MTDREFVSSFYPYARIVSKATGIYPDVLLAQWAEECTWGNNMFPNNPGNIRCILGIPCNALGFSEFPTLDSFCASAIASWAADYPGGLPASGTPYEQILRIGLSPWDIDHYGSPPGVNLQPFYAEVLAVDPVIQAVTDLGNYLSGRLTTIDNELTALKTQIAGIATTGGGLTPLQSQALANIQDAVTRIENALKTA